MAQAVIKKEAGTRPQPRVVSRPCSQTEKCPSTSPEASPWANELTRFGAKLEPGGGGQEGLPLGKPSEASSRTGLLEARTPGFKFLHH